MPRAPRTRFAVASVAALAMVAFAACGGDDDDTESTDAPAETTVDPTETAVEPTATADGPDTTAGSTSGGGDVGGREEYVESVRSEIEGDMEDPSQAECFAEAIVSDDVYTAIEEAGVTVEQFGDGPSAVTIDEAQAETIAADLAECGDLAAQFGGDEAETACLTENLDNEQLALVVTLAAFELPPTEELIAGQEAVEACFAASTTTG